jgi:hypothetical protein
MTETSMPDLECPPNAATVAPRCTLLQCVRGRWIRLAPKELSLAGQILSARCRADGIDLPKVKERGGWRQTNLYPRPLLEVWEEHRPGWENAWRSPGGARQQADYTK